MELAREINDLYSTWVWVRVWKSFTTSTSWVWVQFGARSTILSMSSYSRKFYNLGAGSFRDLQAFFAVGIIFGSDLVDELSGTHRSENCWMISDPLRKLTRDTGPELVVMQDFYFLRVRIAYTVSDLICVTIPGPNHTDWTFFQIEQITNFILFSTHVKVVVSFHRFWAACNFSRATSWASCNVFFKPSHVRVTVSLPPIL